MGGFTPSRDWDDGNAVLAWIWGARANQVREGHFPVQRTNLFLDAVVALCLSLVNEGVV